MSTTFYPKEENPNDLFLISSDGVFFAIHQAVLIERSTNQFGGYLNLICLSAFTVPEDSGVINLVLHEIYGFDPTVKYKPSLEQISAMLEAFAFYGLALPGSITRGSPIYNRILTLALSRPLDAYALTSRHLLEELSVEISHRLIALPLHNLTDAQCEIMGPIYLRRLMFLHLGRLERLKALLQEPPDVHTPTNYCDAVDQKHKLHSAWQDAASAAYFEATPNTPVSVIRDHLNVVVDKLTCETCKMLTREKIRKIIVDWTMVKTTI